MKTLARQRDKTEILERVRHLQPGSTARWGRMSPHQAVCHLNDSLRVMTGEKRVSVRPGLVGLLQHTLLKWIALYAPLRWPPGIPTTAELNQEIGGTKPVEFARDVAELESLLQLITTRSLVRQSHPLFGAMSAAAWLRWAYLHLDHHLRQFGA